MTEIMNPTQQEIKLLIDNALLQNNERINTAIQASADKITAAVDRRTDAYIGQITTLAEGHGALKTEVETLKGKLNNIWGKLIGIGTGIAAITALVTLVLTK